VTGDRAWLRPSIAKKVGLLLFLVTCGGALTLAAFLWYQRAQTVDGQLIALSGSQASLADQFPIYGRLVVLGAPDAQARLRAHARSFEAMLTLLREGGDLGFWHLPPPAADLRAVLDRTADAWETVRPPLQVMVDTPIGTATLEAAHAELAATTDVLAETQRELQAVVIQHIVARDTQMRWLLGAVLGADLVLFGLGLVLSHRFVARPIQLLRDATIRVAAGDVHQPVPVLTGDELGALAEGFNTMSAELARLHEVETQLRQTQKLEAVGQLAAGIAHDFNNLLQGIEGYTALLLDQCPPAEVGPRADLEQIHSLVERGAGLTRQLLIFGRQRPLTAQPLHLQTQVRQGAEFLRRLIRENILLEVGPDPEAGWIQADPGQIDQVLMNLATNAQDAMPHGGRLTLQTGTLRVIDPVPTRPGLGPGDYVTLAVRDTGTGIDERTQARIFEPFFTTKDIGQGTGLGLSTVYGILTYYRGLIFVDSQLGQGTTFTLYLPRVDAPPQVVAPSPSDRDRREPARTGADDLVLLVEDHPAVREIARRALDRAGHRVLVAEGPWAALTLPADTLARVTLLVTDVVMPDMSGVALYAQLAQRTPALRVLYMSGYAKNTVEIPEALFLEKPYTLEGLVGRVRTVLDEPAPPDAVGARRIHD